ncbi:MAG TPA: bifunctional proline dehydrogenase/L-glutamate gamma-semialdehyde dehydrogenase, partial [Oceanospirillales bacterium]|nr:bifunctional proline dehydrogenase/L-glutamate gamma-semialdehyde dehydrogenase [Oceanospirillales bacterium]
MTSLIAPQLLCSSNASSWTCDNWLEQIQLYYHADETLIVRDMAASLPASMMSYCSREAATLVAGLRQDHELTVFDDFMREYSLDNEEGLILMIMAEALLRIPDKATRDAFIRAEMSQADWEKHLNHSESRWVNLATCGLNASGKLSRMSSRLARLLSGPGQPVIRKALDKAMTIMGNQFVLGQTIGEAVRSGQGQASATLTHSFDMLGEAALTTEDALHYLDAYQQALEAISSAQRTQYPASLSVKLSALHPRYEESRRAEVLEVLGERLGQLVKRARELNIPLTVDAEEADRLELSLALFQQVLEQQALGWGGFGLAVQAYGKRALPVLGWLNRLAADTGTAI